MILANWKRPENIKPILEAIAAQTMPVSTLIVNAGSSNLKAMGIRADQIVKLSKNEGSLNRFLASRFVDTEYTYIHDDDMVPGERCLESLLWHYRIAERPGILGQIGRNIEPDGLYRAINAPAGPVDLVVRGYFMRTADLVHVDSLLAKFRECGQERPDLSDDILMGAAMRMAGLTNYVVEATNPQEKINKKELPAPHAVWQQPLHCERRTRLLKFLNLIGWSPLSCLLP